MEPREFVQDMLNGMCERWEQAGVPIDHREDSLNWLVLEAADMLRLVREVHRMRRVYMKGVLTYVSVFGKVVGENVSTPWFRLDCLQAIVEGDRQVILNMMRDGFMMCTVCEPGRFSHVIDGARREDICNECGRRYNGLGHPWTPILLGVTDKTIEKIADAILEE